MSIYKRARKAWLDEDAVSPVIGVILLVAITVVLASVLYIWVSSLIVTTKDTPSAVHVVDTKDATVIQVKVESVTDSKPANTINYQVLTSNGAVETDPGGRQFSGFLSDIYELNTTNDDIYVSFRDNNQDGKLSPGDIIQIKKSAVATGDYLRVSYSRTNGGKIFETLGFP